jgi:uncharacterized protein (DUF58 family)
VDEFYYRVRRPALGHFPGSHRSRRGEHGLEYRGHAPLIATPDARRIDLRRSLSDPWEQWLVRVFDERKAVPVYLIADLSGSTGYEGAQRRLDVLADFTAALAWSAYRSGDSFGFVGCDDVVRGDWLLPLSHDRGAGIQVAQRLRALRPRGSARGLLEAHRWLRRQRSLVFVASDFHLPLEQVDTLLATLAPHEVVPVVLSDSTERVPPRNGLAWLIDAESGRRRPVWVRPALRERWERARVERTMALDACFERHRLDPLRLDDAFDPMAVTAHFHC